MDIELTIRGKVAEAIQHNYGQEINKDLVLIQKTRKEFKGDLTIVVFPFLRFSKKTPELTAEEIAVFLKNNLDEVIDFNIIKGFLNLNISSNYWLAFLDKANKTKNYGFFSSKEKQKTVVIEYSSPNTNKPLHLGHIRNNLIGFSVSRILEANGHKVVKVNLVNDRGIHICKSMLSWIRSGENETPENSGKKGDHLVGEYYVKFDKEYRKEIQDLMSSGLSEKEALIKSPIILEAQEMLRKWEAKDKEIIKLWEMMNSWVYEGFDETYRNLGVDFDKIYYESETYKLGKSIILDGLGKDIFSKKPDGSVWVDMKEDGLDEKILLRSDGTSVYITQDVGTAVLRHKDYNFDDQIYVVGNEQNYHFQVLALIIKKLGYTWAKNLIHLSYGMVELPAGKMKSREGTVVDADDIIEEMVQTAAEMSVELGKLDGYDQKEKENIFHIIGLGALKYFILKIDPKKNMTFDPKESIDFNGNTGPFIQYTYSRILSVLRKAKEKNVVIPPNMSKSLDLSQKEQDHIKLIYYYSAAVREAGEEYNPGIVANYCYDLVKSYNQFYHDYPILSEQNENLRGFRIILSQVTARIIHSAMDLLGIEVPDRM